MRVAFHASSSWVVPDGVTEATVECWGGGGAGGNGSAAFRGGGGAGGAYARSDLTGLVPGSSHNVNVAAGGSTGQGGSSQFRNATDTSPLVTGGGGLAGSNASALSHGSGATSQSSSLGAVIRPGGNGAGGTATGGGGGGGGSGFAGNGFNASGSTGGSGGGGDTVDGAGGSGGDGGGLASGGSPGLVPGGGGGGGGTLSSGASGGAGRIRVAWEAATDEVTVADAAVLISEFTRAMDENAVAADEIALTLSIVREFSDGVVSVDVFGWQIGKVAEDVIAAEELVVLALGKPLGDSATATDQMTRFVEFVRAHEDEAGAVDAFSKMLTLNFADSTATSDSLGGGRRIYIFED